MMLPLGQAEYADKDKGVRDGIADCCTSAGGHRPYGDLGSPGTAVMGHRYNGAREAPCEMIAAQVHGGSRYGRHHSGSAELARCSRPLHTEDRARALAYPRR